MVVVVDPDDEDGRWWIVWKRRVARVVDVVRMDWIEERVLREPGRRGSDAIASVVVVIVAAVMVESSGVVKE